MPSREAGELSGKQTVIKLQQSRSRGETFPALQHLVPSSIKGPCFLANIFPLLHASTTILSGHARQLTVFRLDSPLRLSSPRRRF